MMTVSATEPMASRSSSQWMASLSTPPAQVPEQPGFVLGPRFMVKPAPCGIVVMGPGVDHTVAYMVMWGKGILGHIIPKGKQQNLHARQVKIRNDFPDLRSDDPQDPRQ